MKKIIISEYNFLWPQFFENEKEKLTDILPSKVVIEHIGSTSVLGLASKPIIDIMIGVPSLERADELYIELIKSIEYIYVPEYEKHTPERRYFRKLNKKGIAIVHIHLVKYNSSWWKRHIQFRDYLRHHPEAVQEYADLKKKLAAKFIDTNEYANAKTTFVKRIEALAKKL